MKGLTLTTKEQTRIQVLNAVLEGEVTAVKAAGLMGVSERHGRRLLAAYRKEGAAAIAHGNRGRKPSTTTCPDTQHRVRESEGRYAGFNHTHLTEMLAEREGIALSRSTVRRVLLADGVRSPRRRRASKRYSRRERYPQEGMLLQIDGSRHDWLEGRGPYLVPSSVLWTTPQGRSPSPCSESSAHGYLLMLREIIDHHGVPLAYSDRHGIFHRSTNEPETIAEQLQGRPDPTQFGRALQELDIRLIMAHTPQAKGRIERAWGTFQDRLVSELRLTGASAIEQANKVLWDFIPRYNEDSRSPQPSQAQPIAHSLLAPPSMRRSASSICALSPTTTPSSSTAPPSSYCPMITGPASRAPQWRSRNGSTAASW